MLLSCHVGDIRTIKLFPVLGVCQIEMIQLPLFDIVYTCLSDNFFLWLFLIKLPVSMKEINFKFVLHMLA